MKKIFIGLTCIVMAVCLAGCGMNYPELPDDEPSFEIQSITYDDDSNYATIEYNERTYVPFGTLKNTIKEKDLDKCIGYVLQENNDMDVRLFTLVDDPNNDFLMEHYISTTLMNQPMFLRALDTKGEDVEIPNFVQDLDYEIWK